jgi:hypothetical protein
VEFVVDTAKISVFKFVWFSFLLYVLVLAICVGGWTALGAPGDPRTTTLATVMIAASMPVLFGIVAAFCLLLAKGLITFGGHDERSKDHPASRPAEE